MASPKLLTGLLIAFLSFPFTHAGLCKPKSSHFVSISTTVASETASGVLSSSIATSTASSTEVLITSTEESATLSLSISISTATIQNADTTTTSETTVTTDFSSTTGSETSTTAESPGACSTLGPLLDQRSVTPSDFQLGLETCDGSYAGDYRVSGSGNAGVYPWKAIQGSGDVATLQSDGQLSYISELYVAAQEPGSDVVSIISKLDSDRASWTRLTCQAITASNSLKTYLTCFGDGPQNSIFQVCQPSLSELPGVLISSAVSAGCIQARLVVLEQS
ncbi:uncharacterized protein BKA55DRAFT_677890 [Fusarium redolens]|uniref:Uncharacterized protein n=1 Tax=Fusarium redolens TaxID=48865 RepID=A0A9P9GMG5_FUSRE|nr:uncharacterized protein BKA55DRAFT_677890 [Fusarium redolens]KAH7240684.1 hypothetical protein BKA55DRAFT_677890 [Fusarium redolens]